MADKRTQLETVIQTAIDTALKEMHTCLPAVVTRIDHANQLIDAQITIKRKLAGELINLPLLVDVPLRFWRSKTFSITFPIEIGDHVKITFAERSIDTWLTEGGIQNPFDFRKHDLSDAFAEPVMYHQKDVIPDFDPDNLEIKTNSGSTKIIINKTEGVTIETTGPTSVTSSKTTINNNVDIIGDLGVSGKIDSPVINASTSMSVNSKDVESHGHPQGNDSNGDTQQNTGGML